ncbi:MAG TPA: hypothetical protein ENI23_17335 [bacterium]|nr:hypothetical protein [bacterium]
MEMETDENLDIENRIILAADGLDVGEIFHMASILEGMIWGFKFNDFMDDHNSHLVIDELDRKGYGIFADLKLYDIPNTMANRVRKLAQYPIYFLTVHMSAGLGSILAATEAVPTENLRRAGSHSGATGFRINFNRV